MADRTVSIDGADSEHVSLLVGGGHAAASGPRRSGLMASESSSSSFTSAWSSTSWASAQSGRESLMEVARQTFSEMATSARLDARETWPAPPAQPDGSQRATMSFASLDSFSRPVQGRISRGRVLRESAAFLVLGMSGWWTLNALLNELPVFVCQSVEREQIGNQLSVATQLGNMFPFIYTAASSRATQQRLLVANTVGCQAVALAVAMVCAMGWEHTVEVFGAPRSVLLLLGTVLAGGVGCMSNVTCKRPTKLYVQGVSRLF